METHDAMGREATPNELSEIEVDEVSLVDRPATGRRFVLFKRGGLLRRVAREENANIRLWPDAPPIARADLDALEKRAEDARAEVMNAMERYLSRKMRQVTTVVWLFLPPLRGGSWARSA